MKFKTHDAALDHARTHGADHVHFHQFWRVEKNGDSYMIAVRSRNTGLVAGYVR